MGARLFLPLMKIRGRYTGLCQPQCNVVFWHWWDWASPVLCASGEDKLPQALPLGFSSGLASRGLSNPAVCGQMAQLAGAQLGAVFSAPNPLDSS